MSKKQRTEHKRGNQLRRAAILAAGKGKKLGDNLCIFLGGVCQKGKFAVLLAMGLMGLMGPMSARGQGTTNSQTAPTQPQFYQQVFAWATSFNTNLTWTTSELEIAVGADFQQNQQWANDVDAQFNLIALNNSLAQRTGLGARIRNAGIAGTVESYEAKVGFKLMEDYDFTIEGDLYGGYDHLYRCGVFEPEVDFRKKMTQVTFVGLYVSEPVYINNHGGPNPWTPNIGIETGFTGETGPVATQVALHTKGAHLMYHVTEGLNRLGDGIGSLFAKRGD